MKNNLKIIKNHVFFTKVMFFWKKKPPAGLHQTEDRIGMHQTPHFQSKSIKSSNHRIEEVGGRGGSLEIKNNESGLGNGYNGCLVIRGVILLRTWVLEC